MTLSKKQALTALVITYNEEHNIKAVLDHLAFADEIIVVDSFSSDSTFEIASSFKNVKVAQRIFDDFASQRNYALSLATNSWILFIDADERLTPDLKEEIIKTINSDTDVSAYLFYRKFFFKRKVLRFSGWQTDRIFRLFKKDKARYTYKRLVHEKLDVEGKIGFLKHKLIHYSYSDYGSYKNKMVTYGRLKAKEKFLSGFKPTVVYEYGHPIYNFLYQYLIRLGVLDGRKGVIICYLNALSVKVRYQELNKLYNKK